MPVLGGHQPHKWSEENEKGVKAKNKVHQLYQSDNDIAGQLKNVEPYRDYCKMPSEYYLPKKEKSFLNAFVDKFTKWLTKEEVEVD